MNIKQKIIKDKNELPKNRYNLQGKNCDSTPSLLKAREILQNKENNINHRNKNHQTERDMCKNNQLQMLRSMEIPKRLRTSINEDENMYFRRQNKLPQDNNGLLSSQELFNFKQRKGQKYESAHFGEHMTFGEVNNKRQMMTSREFLEEKQIKNDVIDGLISNARRELCKSFNEFNKNDTGNCANHPGKKAKYRLISQLTEGQQQMFYCSKCAINLLQQGFKIEQIRGEQLNESNGLFRNQQIAKFQLRLKSLQQRTRGGMDQNDHKQDLEMIQEQIFNCNKKFGEIFQFLQEIRKQRINNLNKIYYKIDSQKKGRRQNLNQMLINIGDIQREIEQYRQLNKFSTMKENQFQFIATNLINKFTLFQDNLSSVNIPSPKQRLSLELTSIQNILEKLKIGLLQQSCQPRTRRERQITFQRRVQMKAAQVVQEQFGCDQLKKPFRILFPPDQSQHNLSQRQYQKRSMLSSVRQCPTFGQYP